MSRGLDLLGSGPRGDGLLEGPLDGPEQPRVAGVVAEGGSVVDAFEHVVWDAEKYFLVHPAMLARLLSASTTDSMMA